jgi:hypothetical protein
LIEPVAKEIAKHLNRNWKVSGPFGICCEWMLEFYELGKPLEYKPGDDTVITMTVTVENYEGLWTLRLRDYSKNTGEFKDNTIGAMNGMNHPAEEVPPEAGVEWFLKKLGLLKPRTVDDKWMAGTI